MPHTKSLAGVAAKLIPSDQTHLFSSGQNTEITELPDFVIEPNAFSTMLTNPPSCFREVFESLPTPPSSR